MNKWVVAAFLVMVATPVQGQDGHTDELEELCHQSTGDPVGTCFLIPWVAREVDGADERINRTYNEWGEWLMQKIAPGGPYGLVNLTNGIASIVHPFMCDQERAWMRDVIVGVAGRSVEEQAPMLCDTVPPPPPVPKDGLPERWLPPL